MHFSNTPSHFPLQFNGFQFVDIEFEIEKVRLIRSSSLLEKCSLKSLKKTNERMDGRTDRNKHLFSVSIFKIKNKLQSFQVSIIWEGRYYRYDEVIELMLLLSFDETQYLKIKHIHAISINIFIIIINIIIIIDNDHCNISTQ